MKDQELKKMRLRAVTLSSVLLAALSISGCTNSFSDYIGTSKKSPDESKIAVNQPLAYPPDYTLRPPTDAPRAKPQPQSVRNDIPQPIPPRRTVVDNSVPQPIAPRPQANRQPVQPPLTRQAPSTLTTASIPNQPQQGRPTQLGRPGSVPSTTAQKPAKPMTGAEYQKQKEQLRQQELARKRTKNPQYGTWRNVWNAMWN